jgi:hypothetical protein
MVNDRSLTRSRTTKPWRFTAAPVGLNTSSQAPAAATLGGTISSFNTKSGGAMAQKSGFATYSQTR